MVEEEEVELPAPVTLLEMSDCVGAVSNTVAFVAKPTFSVAIILPWTNRQHLVLFSCGLRVEAWLSG